MSKRSEKQEKQFSVTEHIEEWLAKLATHFGAELGEEQISIFTHALRNNTAYQIDEAFDRCLNECEFMPKLADVHKRMPEQQYPRENSGKFVLGGRPILDLVRPIAKEICKEMTDRDYDSLNAMILEETSMLFNVCAAANRLRYERMGINTSKWGALLQMNVKNENGKPRFTFKDQKPKP